MASSILPKTSYTPEYSDELLGLIVELYKDEIKLNLNDLQLTKMIDLIDIAQYNIEQYSESLTNGNHNRCLKYYIVGLFYIYLIIPNSIQFQIKNKNYEIFLFLKQLYEKETNMSNVKLQVINYITYLNEKKAKEEIIVKSTHRSATLPSSSLQHDLTQFLLSNEVKQSSPTSSSNSSVISLSSDSSSSIVEEWSPPNLQPDDQLKLVNSDNLDDDSNPSPPHPGSIKHPNSFQGTNNYSFDDISTEKFPFNPDDEEIPSLKTFQTKKTHRKDSYQSVYANEDDEFEVLTIDSTNLYNDLLKGEVSYLIFDIRPKSLFEINHIPYGNLIQLDPSIILNSLNYQEFEDSLKLILNNQDFLKFKNLNKFNLIISYSDNKTFFENKNDYIIKFSNLLNEANINPKTLSGGFDQWLKFLSNTNLNSNKLKFKTKVPLFNIPQLPSIPAPPIPSTNIPSNLVPISKKSTSFDYDKMFPSRSISPTSNNSLVPIGRAPIATPAYQNQKSSTLNYQRPAQPVQNYQINSHPYPINHYYNANSNPELNNAYSYQNRPTSYPAPVQPPVTHHAPPLQPPPQLPPHQPSQYYQQFQQVPRTKSRVVPTIQNSPHPFVRLSITGLRNMRNTCYINSMIQCLFESRNFRNLFLDYKYQEYFNYEFFNKLNNNNQLNNSSDPNVRLSTSIAKLFEKMYLNGGCSIVPSGFLKNCVHLRPDLNIPFEQQDTQEFLMFLLDRLHDELSNSNKVINDNPELLNIDQNGKLGKDYENWFNSILLKQGFSPISQNFQGQLQDSLTCMRCGFKSSNYSSFFMLSLGIPKRSLKNGKKLKKIYLEDCIELFTNDEILNEENAWDCPKCNKPKSNNEKEVRKHRLHFTKNSFKFRGRSSSPPSNKLRSESSNDLNSRSSKNSTIKSLKFITLPPTLIIHLSRFLFYDTSKKDDSIIQYPLILTIMDDDKPVKYKLFGVVNHSGTLKSGHYTSIVNKNLNHDLERPNWYYFDDEVVKDTKHGKINTGVKDADRMSSSTVYVLFYERI